MDAVDKNTFSAINSKNASHLDGIGSDLVDHANRMGIRLRSAKNVRQTHMEISDRLTANRVTTTLSNCTKWDVVDDWTNDNSNGLQQTYLSNVVIPLSQQSNIGDDCLLGPYSQQKVRVKSALPRMTQQKAKLIRPVSSYLDRFVSSTPAEMQAFANSNRNNSKQWNMSGQALRYQNEQENKARTRILRRIAVVQPHRLDPMYYISGTRVPLDNRYSVNKVEFNELKHLATERRKAPHYGRGLRNTENLKMNGNVPTEEFQLPYNPPNSELDDVNDSIGVLSPHPETHSKIMRNAVTTPHDSTISQPLKGQSL